MQNKLMDDLETMLAKEPARKALDFFANVPCPMKPAFKEAYEKMAAAHYAETGEAFYSYILTQCGSYDQRITAMSEISAQKDADELPALFYAYGLDELCEPEFQQKFTKAGVFEELPDFHKDRVLLPPEFDDPYHSVNVAAHFPYGLLADKLRLGDKPAPRRLADLLDPMYAGCLSIPDSHGEVDVTLPLFVQKFYGEEGLKALERNAGACIPTLDAVKLAGNPARNGAPLYFVNWMFANSNVKSGKAELIWFEDGAPCEPVVLMARKNRDCKTNRIVEFLASEEVGSLFAKIHLPVTDARIQNHLPEGAAVRWLGWDYLYENDIPKRVAELAERFTFLLDFKK